MVALLILFFSTDPKGFFNHGVKKKRKKLRCAMNAWGNQKECNYMIRCNTYISGSFPFEDQNGVFAIFLDACRYILGRGEAGGAYLPTLWGGGRSMLP